MSSSTPRSPRSKTPRTARVLATLLFSVLLMALLVPASLAHHSTEHTTQTCPDGGGWVKVNSSTSPQPNGVVGPWGSLRWGGTSLDYVVNAGSTVDICIKSGSDAFQSGLFTQTTTHVGPTTGTLTIRQDISHVSYRVTTTSVGPTITPDAATPVCSVGGLSVGLSNAGSTVPIRFVVTNGAATLYDDTLAMNGTATVQVPVTEGASYSIVVRFFNGATELTAEQESFAGTRDCDDPTPTITPDAATPVCSVGGLSVGLSNAGSTVPIRFVVTNGAATLYDDTLAMNGTATVQVPVTEGASYSIVVRFFNGATELTAEQESFSGVRDCEGVGSVVIDEPQEPVVEELDPRIRVIKTADDTSYSVGDTITYTYVITNTGDTTLTTVSLRDDKLGNLTNLIGDRTLEPGEDVTVTTTQEALFVHIPSLTNTAVASGLSPEGRVEDEDTVTVDVSEVLGIIIEKPPAPAPEPEPAPEPAPEVEAVELPRTGTDPARSALLATAMLALGGLLLRRTQPQ